jgi:hypothetical protein
MKFTNLAIVADPLSRFAAYLSNYGYLGIIYKGANIANFLTVIIIAVDLVAICAVYGLIVFAAYLIKRLYNKTIPWLHNLSVRYSIGSFVALLGFVGSRFMPPSSSPFNVNLLTWFLWFLHLPGILFAILAITKRLLPDRTKYTAMGMKLGLFVLIALVILLATPIIPNPPRATGGPIEGNGTLYPCDPQPPQDLSAPVRIVYPCHRL